MAQEGWTVDAEEQMLCTNNCGFLGNPATMNLCSKCYEESLAKQPNSYNNNNNNNNTNTNTNTNNNNNNNKLKTLEETAKELSGKSLEEAVAMRKESIVEDYVIPEMSSAEEKSKSSFPLLQKKQPSPEVSIRCFSCKKRVGLTGIKCRCGSTFCALHRYSDRHNCSFDYRTSARAIIAKSNPLVKAKKIQKL